MFRVFAPSAAQLLLLLLLLLHAAATAPGRKQPNIVILLADDLGFGDIGANGNSTIHTPNIDRIAKEGLRLSHHLTAAPVCTPSRAALLTGKYPIRTGMVPQNRMQVIGFSASQAGLPPNETTFAKVAQRAGYATGLVGKWHLGVHCGNTKDYCHHPNSHGFDYFYGCLLTLLKEFSGLGESVVLSNFPNMRRNLLLSLAAALGTWLLVGKLRLLPRRLCWLLALLSLLLAAALLAFPAFSRRANGTLHRQKLLVEQPIRFERLTQRLVWEGEEFMERAAAGGKPFLLFMSYLHAHTPLYNSVAGFRGRSRHGHYGDVVEELDWSVGRILDALDRRGLAENTIVYFSSDNGGHLEEVTHLGERGGGHNGQYRGGKCQGSQDGGIRVPGLLRWPGVVQPGSVSDAMTSQMDLFPTLVSAMGQPVPRGLDGRGLDDVLRRPASAASPHEFLFQYCSNELHAIRWSHADGVVYKLRLMSPDWLPGTEGCGYVCGCHEQQGASVRHRVPLLHKISEDPTERRPVPPESPEYAEVSAKMLQAMRLHQQRLQAAPSELTFGKLLWRPWLQDCCNFPFCDCRDSKFDAKKE